MDRAKQFRESAAQENEGRQKSGWRYSRELRTLAAEHCRRQREAGYALTEVAAELGVSTVTLSRWLEDRPSAGFLPVAVVADPAAPESASISPLTAVTPGGLRLEGLTWSQVMELARVYR